MLRNLRGGFFDEISRFFSRKNLAMFSHLFYGGILGCVFAIFSQRHSGSFSFFWSAVYQGFWQNVEVSPRLFDEVLGLLSKNFWRLLFGGFAPLLLAKF